MTATIRRSRRGIYVAVIVSNPIGGMHGMLKVRCLSMITKSCGLFDEDMLQLIDLERVRVEGKRSNGTVSAKDIVR